MTLQSPKAKTTADQNNSKAANLCSGMSGVKLKQNYIQNI